MFFDTENEKAEERPGFEPVPSGWYRLLIDSAETKATKKGTGKFIKMVFSGIDGKAKNRKFFHNFNIQNQSETAQRIGKSEFKKLLTAIGVTTGLSSEEDMKLKVTNKTCYVLLGTKKRDDGETENSCKDFADKPKDSSPAAKKSAKAEDNLPF